LTAGGIYSGSVTVEMSSATANATLRYTTDGSAVTQSSPEYTDPITLGEGATTVNARCFRTGYAASNTATVIYNVTAIPTAPLVTAPPAPQAVQAGAPATFTVAYTGFPIPEVQWQFEGRDLAGETEPELVIPSTQGGNAGSYRAVVRNSDGEVTSPAVDLTVSGTPVSGLTVDNSSPTPLGNPTFFAATIGSGSDVAYNWSFGDGTVGTGQTLSHTYSIVGLYTVTVTATNRFNSQRAMTLVTVTEGNTAISGLAATNSSPTPLGNATFFAATITAGSDVSYGWDFGDGTIGAGQTISHTYATAGVYTATVTASNLVSTESAETFVSVQEIPVEPADTIYLPLIQR